MKRKPSVVAALLAIALGAAAPAGAQSTEDPAPDSPSGTIYEIPLDDGRGDAAPRGDAGVKTPSSSIHSANGFGSSSTVPGTSAPEPAATPAATATAAPGERAAGKRSPKPEPTPEETAGERQIPSGAAVIEQSAGNGSPAVPRAMLMIVLGVVVAAGLAGAARLATRGR